MRGVKRVGLPCVMHVRMERIALQNIFFYEHSNSAGIVVIFGSKVGNALYVIQSVFHADSVLAKAYHAFVVHAVAKAHRSVLVKANVVGKPADGFSLSAVGWQDFKKIVEH